MGFGGWGMGCGVGGGGVGGDGGGLRVKPEGCGIEDRCLGLEATHGQMDSFFSQLPYKCYLEEVASVGD